MSIDYNRLRELRDEHTPGPWEQATRGQIGNRELRMIVALVGGDESGEQIGDCNLEADRELIALAPNMARELLRLRDGVRELVESKRDAAGALHEHASTGVLPQHLHNAATAVEFMCDNLTDLLNGDTE